MPILYRALFNDNNGYILTGFGFAALASLPLWFLFGVRTRAGRVKLCVSALVTIIALTLILFAGNPARVIFMVLVCALCYVYAVWRRAGNLTVEKRAFLICAASLALRIFYVQATTCFVRQHDVNLVSSGTGHLAYIDYILKNGFRFPALDIDPQSVYQFYHPPLHYYISALWIKLQTFLGSSVNDAYEGVQALTLTYGAAINLCMYSLLKRVGLKKRALLISFAFCCFSPIFIFFSGSVNNDCLMCLLFLLTIVLALKWYVDPSPQNIALIALTLALCALAKLSGALAAVPVAVLFLIKLVKSRDRRALIKQFALFLIVCAPLGASYAVFSYIKHGMPLNYVARISEYSPLYIGEYGALERVFGFDIEQLRTPYCTLMYEHRDYNILLTMLKQSAFEEFTLFAQGDWRRLVSMLLFFVNAIVAAEVVRGAILGTRRRILRKRFGARDMALIAAGASITISFIMFCFDFPHTCTMNMRYVAPMVPLCMGALGTHARGLKYRQILCATYCALVTAQYIVL